MRNRLIGPHCAADLVLYRGEWSVFDKAYAQLRLPLTRVLDPIVTALTVRIIEEEARYPQPSW